MQHGWVVRGDLNDAQVSHDTNKAIELIHDYFSKFKWYIIHKYLIIMRIDQWASSFTAILIFSL
jgi:hypothetical protein